MMELDFHLQVLVVCEIHLSEIDNRKKYFNGIHYLLVNEINDELAKVLDH
jgi:hypothetical protein